MSKPTERDRGVWTIGPWNGTRGNSTAFRDSRFGLDSDRATLRFKRSPRLATCGFSQIIATVRNNDKSDGSLQEISVPVPVISFIHPASQNSMTIMEPRENSWKTDLPLNQPNPPKFFSDHNTDQFQPLEKPHAYWTIPYSLGCIGNLCRPLKSTN